MNTIQPALDPGSSMFSDWLQDAVDLVHRVNARLKSAPAAGPGSMAEPARHVLTDERCLELAALVPGMP